VPKVGSQTLMSLFTILSHRNNFTAYKDDGDNVRLQGETTMVKRHKMSQRGFGQSVTIATFFLFKFTVFGQIVRLILKGGQGKQG